MQQRFPWPWIAPILLYAASALEVILMVSPFAAYFYSVYTPLLHGMTRYAATSWLPRFFLPHLAHPDNLLFRIPAYAGPVLAVLGAAGFFACAVQLYYGKFVRKRLVNGGLYGRVRHPQYLCLAVAGLGFLLMWPRFFILLTYLMMLGLYYLLARHEEEAVAARYGKEGALYTARIPMFNPLRGPGRAKYRRPPSRGKALAVWAGLVIASLGLSFLLRAEAISELHAVQWQSPNVTAISFVRRTHARITAIMQSVLAAQPIRTRLRRHPEAAYLMQIATGGSEVRHLLTDLGMKAGAIRALRTADRGDYAVVSRVRSSAPGMRAPDPFALTSRIEPLFFVRSRGLGNGLEVRPFVPGAFYPDFMRILF